MKLHFHFKHILSRLLFMSSIIMIIVLIMILGLPYYVLKKQLKASTYKDYIKNLELMDNTFSKLLVEDDLKMVLALKEEISDDVIQYKENLSKGSQEEQESFAFNYSSAPESLIEKFNLISSQQKIAAIYVTLIGSKKLVASVPYTDLPTDYNPATRPWYLDVVNRKNYFEYQGSEVFIQSPYQDIRTKDTIMTFSTLIKDENGKDLAILSFDFLLSSIDTIFEKTDLDFFFILEDGLILINPDKKDDSVNIKDKYKFITDSFLQKKHINSIINNNNEIYIKYTLNLYNNLGLKESKIHHMAFLVRDKTYKKNLNNSILEFFLTAIIPILIVLACVFSVMLFILYFKMVRPLTDIETKIDSMTEGVIKPSSPIKEFGTKDEIATIIYGVNEFEKVVEKFIKKLNLNSKLLKECSDKIKSNCQVSVKRSGDSFSIINEISQKSINLKSEFAYNKEHIQIILDKMADYLVKIDENSSLISKTKESIDEIVRKVYIIDEISANTNIIAINASIEASRAKAGSSFSVVANEIKKLAEESSRASSDINELISGISQTSNNSNLILQSLQKEFTDMKSEMQIIVSNYNKNENDIISIDLESKNLKTISEESLKSSEATKKLSSTLDNSSNDLINLASSFRMDKN